MVVKVSLRTPVCNLCDKTLNNMEQLNIHMKNVHQESEHERIYRVTATVKSALAQESK